MARGQQIPMARGLNKSFMIGDTCPVNDLPPELLSCIFELGHGACQVEHDAIGIFPEQRGISSKGPTVGDVANHNGDKRAGEHVDQESFGPSSSFRISVCLVSRYWHNVATSTPSLWTTITVPSLPAAHPPSCTLLSLLLKRSNGLPIDIDLGGDCRPYMYPLLVSHVHRWHSVKAEFHSYEGMDAFLHAVGHPSISAASRLTTLQLYRQEDTEEPDTDRSRPLERFTLFGGSAPYLERLTLWGIHVDWNQAWISSASNLTSLELGSHVDDACPSWVQFASILRGAPALKTLKLYALGLSVGFDWLVTYLAELEETNPPIQLLKLTNFSIEFLWQGYAILLFRKLYMPSLTSLTLCGAESDHTDLIRNLAGPSTSPAPPSPDDIPHSLLSKLENLKIIYFPSSREGIEMLYGELQNLKSLSIALYHLSSSFLDVLLFPCMLPGGDVWLPLLETLYVSQIPNNFTPVRLLVQKRKDVGVPLKSLYLEESCGIDLENLIWFKENVETFGFFEEVYRANYDPAYY